PVVPLREQDQVLNEYYRELMDRLRDPRRSQLRPAQRAWLKDRDLRCDLDPTARDREQWFRVIEGDPSKLACVTRLTQHRLAALQMNYGSALADWWHKTVPKPDWEQDGELSAKKMLSPNAISKGKVYFEISISQAAMAPGTDLTLWIQINGDPIPESADGSVSGPHGHTYGTGFGSGSPFHGDFAGNLVIGIAADLDNGHMYLRNNGRWVDGEPGTGSGTPLARLLYRGSVSSNVVLAPLMQRGLLQVNFGADTFLYPLPAGYLPFDQAATR
ncbi:MAG: lysozyme inhibitor LprI family protein, partial [Acidobacteria bacterium]|nr:lysozyme inhibitor LprI family protein [Acidobacteriota bacterium]